MLYRIFIVDSSFDEKHEYHNSLQSGAKVFYHHANLT